MATDPRFPANRSPRARRPEQHPTGRLPSWYPDVAAASGINTLIGVWLVLSPWILPYEYSDPWWNPLIFGAVTATLGLLRFTSMYRESSLSLLNALVGAWLFASAFWLSDSTTASWNVGIAGAAIAFFAMMSAWI